MRRALAAGFLAGALLFAAACGRENPTGWAYELSHQLMSPFCPGRTLPDCPSPQAAELQRWIREQERIGRPRSDVEAELYTQFGDVILQSPRAGGFGLAAYVIPVVLFLSGGLLLVYFLRRQTQKSAVASSASGGLRPVDPELERRLEAELRESDPDR
ncbi:MAG TPA: cytochrome c-type biogenesis protein CcmH [Myxococcota bacterium]|nr:cytochrome c-type biogenesis protein CcmH [Myxococcota bacterium]